MTTEQLEQIEANIPYAAKVGRYFRLTELPTLDRDDRVSIAYLSLCESIGKYDAASGIALSTYLQRRIRWDLLDCFRKQFRTYTHNDEAVLFFDDWMTDLFPVADPDVADAVAVRQAFGNLTEKQRKAVYLYFYRGLTLKEIAKQLGNCSEKNVSQIISYGLRALRGQLEETGVSQ